jgi:PAS domain S-box-containing protein
LLLAFGLLLFHLSAVYLGKEPGLWLAPLGLGILLTAWLGWWAVLPLFADLFLVKLWSAEWSAALVDSFALSAEIGFSWWCYAIVGKGSRRLDDPRSAVLFLVLVPGVLAAGFAGLQVFVFALRGAEENVWNLAGDCWRARALGILVLVPPLLVTLTPLWVQSGLISAEPRRRQPIDLAPTDWTWGETIEIAGLSITAGILGILLAVFHSRQDATNWHLWGLSLLVIVWAGLRQGLRGGTVAATTGALMALLVASAWDGAQRLVPDRLIPLQGNLLAQVSAALLVGASAGWVRASESLYRQVIGHIPVILYSVRVPRWVPARFTTPKSLQPGHKKIEGPSGAILVEYGEITLVSPACKTILGCEPDELLGPVRGLLDRILPQDKELVVAALAQLCLQKQPVTCEYRLLPNNDERRIAEVNKRSTETTTESGDATLVLASSSPAVPTRWLRDTLAPHFGPEGHLDGWEGIVEDITEQRALAHDLRRTTGMLHALVANLPTGVFFVQGKIGQPILVNGRARQLLGQREIRSAGLSHLSQVYRLHRPDGSVYPWEELPVARALRLGASSMVDDIVVHRADGRRVPLVSWAAPIDLNGMGKYDAAVWVMEDLSALRQAEASRQESETRLRTAETKYRDLIENLPLMVLQFNPDGQIFFTNSATFHILGFSSDEMKVPGFWHSRIHPDDRPQFSTALERTRKGYVTRVECRLRAKDNCEKIGYALLQPQMHDDTVVATTCLVVDMTLQRHLETELQRAQRLELIGRIAGGTVHDFNNLLTVITGMAAVAQSNLPADHPARFEVERILEVGEQATHLAGQLLTFSKPGRLEHREVELNTLVVHTLKLLRGTFPPGTIIESKLADAGAIVRGDETQLKQVLMNLCLNAKDAMPSGGKLLVQTESCLQGNTTNGPPTTIESTSRSRQDWVKLIVQDSGVGMDEEVRDHIFEPFFSTKERGTGLGLAVVRQIVESHGGKIDVKSRPQEGTRFEIWLPGTENS